MCLPVVALLRGGVFILKGTSGSITYRGPQMERDDLSGTLVDIPAAETELANVVGRLQILRPIPSQHVATERPLFVWLPSDYDENDRTYPVIYMQDGQNLFSDQLAFGGEWQVDETLERLATVGLHAIVVGIPNAGEGRIREYNPFASDRYGGAAYLRFVVEDVMPLVASRYRVSASRADTGIVGSSLGGLIALYAFFHYPETFGLVGAMSPALWFAHAELLQRLDTAAYVNGRIYLDVGLEEGAEHVQHVHAVHTLLLAKGYRQGRDVFYVEEAEAGHEEAAWARRLRTALYFLLPAP
jgi:predicted alpha/beta superfamily hydrolase